MNIPSLEFKPQDTVDMDLEIIELESIFKRMPFPKHSPFKPHQVKFYCLIYIAQGEGSHFIDFKRYPFQTGSFILINKGQAHAFDINCQPKGQVIFFTKEFVDTTHTSIRMPFFTPTHLATSYFPVFTCNQVLKETCEALLLEINREQCRPNNDKLIMQLLFASLLLIIIREKPSIYASHLSETHIKEFARFMLLIEEKFMKTRDASIYADIMHMTYKSLNNICKLAVNQTAKQLIDAHTILEAKRKLVIEGVQVQELAQELGFEEVTNFVKYFKKHTLVTPAQFRGSFKG